MEGSGLTTMLQMYVLLFYVMLSSLAFFHVSVNTCGMCVYHFMCTAHVGMHADLYYMHVVRVNILCI